MTDQRAEGDNVAPPYSLAFERFVRSPDDFVGLLAYALFKAAVREGAAQGVPRERAARAPVPAMVAVYRQAAEQRVAELIGGAIEQATPEIQASATVAAVEAAQKASVSAVGATEANLKRHVDDRTSFKQAMLTSFAGWLLTLGVTAIIIFLAGRASVEDMVKSAVARPTQPPGIDDVQRNEAK